MTLDLCASQEQSLAQAYFHIPDRSDTPYPHHVSLQSLHAVDLP